MCGDLTVRLNNSRANGHDNMMRMKPVLALSVLAAVLCSAVLVRSAQQPSDDTLKVNVELVNVPFSVTDRHGRFVPSLTAKDFLVEEDGRRQEIRNFARENELPLTIAMLVDTSPSVRPVFDEEKSTAVTFLESVLRPKDLALVIGFDRSVTLVEDYTDNIKQLRRAINELQTGGGTSVYDAIYLACNEKLKDETGRKAIILISDGEDTTSKLKLTEALYAAHRSDAVIYGISNAVRSFFPYGGRRGRAPGGYGGDIATLKKFSDETGGATFVENDQNSFAKIFEQIAQELRSQYNIGYYSTNTVKDGKFRQIKIVPRDSSYSVKARKGYYAARSTDFH
jgi:VWFA-related protein